MLWYKAWRESRTRFLLSALAITVLCASFVFFRNETAGIYNQRITYVDYIWRIVYKSYLREMFAMLVLILGVGGLLRERDYGTAGFTLALPIGRRRLVLARACIGLMEVGVLALLPALVIPPLSQLVGQDYPWSQALQFSLLWTVGGAFILVIGFLASTIFGGEYTAPVAAFLALLVYSAVADSSFAERYSLDIHDVMSGVGMPYFNAHDSLLIGPLPWVALTGFGLATVCLIALAGGIVQRQDF